MASPLSPLLPWFRRHRRDLPWRHTRDPYRIWVSEAMLQQTRVETVLRYYPRFLRRFPTLRALAGAPESRVLKAWEGLGYYQRARNLRRAARIVMERHGGRVPRVPQKPGDFLRSRKVPQDPGTFGGLPGVGPYIRGAVMSIAYGLPEPVLDGNVKRVLARYFGVATPLPRAEPRLWRLAGEVLDVGRPGEFNQALMELGALVCTPHGPDCPRCPLQGGCRAWARGLQNTLPRRAPRRKIPRHQVAVGVVWRGERILIARRPPEGLLGGLWELPGGKQERGETLEECAAREIREETGLQVRVGRRLARVEHAYSHLRVTLHAYECRAGRGEPGPIGCEEVRWVRPGELERYAFPRANRKLFERIGESGGWRPVRPRGGARCP